MSEIDNNQLHDWVRKTMADYQPPYDPQEWQQMRKRIQKRRWRRLSGMLILLVLIGIGGYVVLNKRVSDHHEPVTTYPVESVGGGCTPGEAHIARKTRQRLVQQEPLASASGLQRVRPRTRTVNTSTPVYPETIAAGRLNPIAHVSTSAERTNALPAIRYQPPTANEVALMQQVLSEAIGTDSTALKALSRNLPRWRDAVIVCDLTTSMGPYAAQVYAWFRRNARNSNVLGTVFFTDCDSLGRETRPGGLPGAFFVTRERDPRAALPTMLAAARNTAYNELDAENVVEALRYAQLAFPQAKHLVLLTDNGSGAKDMALLPSLTKPVHVIACGDAATETDAFQADQYLIARQTGGSVHTLEDDLSPLGQVPNRTFVRVGPHYYRYVARQGRFIKTRRTHRPLRFLGINW